MKRIFKLLVVACAAAVVSAAGFSLACVGKTIHLGVAGTEERLLAEMAALLITERTGSSVKIEVFKESRELYQAAQKGNLQVLIESPARGGEVIGKTKDATYEQVKSEYRSRLNMVWLDAIGGSARYAPVLTADALSTYPALPKLLNKLAAALPNDSYAKLLKSAGSDDKLKKAARDFLKSKKLI